MPLNKDYLEHNRKLWNDKVPVHLKSDFYFLQDFVNGKSSLNKIELELLGDVRNKKILHLQCHFGQDSLSLSRMGAKVTGVDLSNTAIEEAKKLNEQLGLDANFIYCDVYDLKNHLNDQFDMVYTSYGTIGWLPDLDRWGEIISHFLAPGGEFIFVEFHPVVWMFDSAFNNIQYSYFNDEEIIENSEGTYADRDAPIQNVSHSWNHSLDEVIGALLKNGITLQLFQEHNYSPYNCFNGLVKGKEGYYIEKHGQKIPMLYSLKGTKV